MNENEITALIIDDEQHARDVVRIYLKSHPDIRIAGECGTGPQAVQQIKTTNPDLIFLDVQMPDLDGFGVIREVGAAALPVTIFVTAYDKYAIRAFEMHALDYLLKPFSQQRFDQALEHAYRLLEQQRTEEFNKKVLRLLEQKVTQQQETQGLSRLTVRESGRIFLIPTQDVDWIEAAGDYVRLHCGKQSYLMNERLSVLAGKLDARKFIRIHRSTIINANRIKELHPYSNGEYHVLLSTGKRLKLSRSFRSSLQKLFGDSF